MEIGERERKRLAILLTTSPDLDNEDIISKIGRISHICVNGMQKVKKVQHFTQMFLVL